MAGYRTQFDLLDAGGEVVTATRRQAQELARSYTARQRAAGRTVWPTPHLLPWSAWLERLWRTVARDEDVPGVLLEQFAATRLWERVVADSPSGSALVDSRAAARGAARAWQLAHEWGIALADVAPVTPEHAAFLGWARAFAAVCREREWLDPARLAARVAAAVSAAPRIVAGRGAIGFHGFPELSPARRAVMDALRAAGRECVELRAEVPAERSAVHAAASPELELEAIAAWAVERLRAQPDARLAVVLPDLAAKWRTVSRVLDDRLQPSLLAPGAPDERPYALSVGPRLRDYAIVDAALLTLGLARDPIDLLPLGRLLRSPYLRGAEEEAGGRARLDAALRRAGRTHVAGERVADLAATPEMACPDFAVSLREVRAALPRDGRRGAATWAAAIEAALRAASWTDGRRLSSAEFQTARKFGEAIATFGSLDRVLGPIGYGRALEELGAIAADLPFQPEAGDPPLLVLDALVDPGLEFDGLWVSGLTADRFPAPANPDPFLPVEMQRALGLPHASTERELDHARRTLAAWRRSAREVVLSWPARDADGELIPSPLLPRDVPDATARVPLESLASRVYASARRVAWRDTALPPLRSAGPVAGGVKVLELQSACAFRAGAERRLGARELERPRAGFDPRERGQLAHAALAAFWRDVHDQPRLAALSDAERRARVEAAIEVARHERGFGGDRSRLLRLECEWLAHAMLALLDVELRREHFEVVGIETDRRLHLGARAFDVRIDRIDRLATGETVIVDYKTGRRDVLRWTGPRPDQPQLQTYAAHLGDEAPVAVAYAKLPRAVTGFRGIAARRGLLPDVKSPDEFRHDALRGRTWESVVEEWRRVTIDLADAYARGVADVDPMPEACRDCRLDGFCRIEERAVDDDEDDGSGEDAATRSPHAR